MTAITSNNTTISANNLTTPLKVALAGLTMLQQSLLEFYFETQEGKQQYIQVLGKDADAYITNFDENGSADAWENLYAHEKKPTLVLSDRHEITNHHVYIPKPITPIALVNAATSLKNLLNNEIKIESPVLSSTDSDFLKFAVDSQKNDTISSSPPNIKDKITLLTSATNNQEVDTKEFSELLPVKEEKNSLTELNLPDELLLIKEEQDSLTELGLLDELLFAEKEQNSFTELHLPNELLAVEKEQNKRTELNLPDELLLIKEEQNSLTELGLLDELLLAEKEQNSFTELSLPDELLPVEEAQDSFTELNLLDNVSTQAKSSIEEIAIPSLEETSVPALEENRIKIERHPIHTGTSQSTKKNNSTDNIAPPDDLQDLLDALTEEELKKSEESLEEEPSKSKKTPVKQQTKEEERWVILCGDYDDINYKIKTDSKSSFKLTNTLLPYLKDTISFSKRTNCWMAVSYKYLSITISPETNHIYSNISLKDKNFIYLCLRDFDEDQIELEEIDKQGIAQFKQNNINKKYFDYSFEYFIWTTSLAVSRGRLADNINPDDRISIKNWLSLKEVEKFPHIMQIAAIFNQHHASLNEVATWMNLPKRYVYAFYNGVEALDMIEKDTKKLNQKSLIAMVKEEKESTLKKILFTKIM